MRIPPAGEQPPKLGNGLTRLLGRGLFALLGWHVEGELPNVPKMVAIGAPHASNFDVVIALSLILGLGVRISWMAKHTAFKPPFGTVFQKLGGLPINRTARFNMVEQMVQKLHGTKRLILAVAPEGSRSRAGIPVDEWKTGFYYIALGASVPIVPVYIDYPNKRIVFAPALTPTGDKTADFAIIQAFYANPDQS
ncbi:MAG: lysophospholipid acyltransferase family protein [Caldilineaceae bacterium]